MTSYAEDIALALQKDIHDLSHDLKLQQVGYVLKMTDGIVVATGLKEAMVAEKVFIGDHKILAVVMNLEYEQVGLMVLGDCGLIQEGDIVYTSGTLLSVPVGNALLGRVVDPLGNPIDGLGAIETNEFLPVERPAPGVIDRQSVSESLPTGIKAIDIMVPIGLGQRELIIGDRQVGKTSLALDAIINQARSGIKCIYVAIGQKNSTVAYIQQKLKENNALEHTIIVNASASDAASLQYLAPYAGCAMGEYFRDRGQDALIVYDDLTKHAWAYRQISLLLRRPPGREAYPGDIFYLHSRLLERASRVSAEYIERLHGQPYSGKTGSLTALPIIETQAGDVSAFVPTNVISITDGQIFLETDLFYSGIRPAVNAGLSVSRVGGAAQTPLIKKLGSQVRLILAQYRELAAFAQFASDLDDATKKQLDRGERVVELLKQKQYRPLSVSLIALMLLALQQGYFDKVSKNQITDIEERLYDFAKTQHADFLNIVNADPIYSEEIYQRFTDILKQALDYGVFEA